MKGKNTEEKKRKVKNTAKKKRKAEEMGRKKTQPERVLPYVLAFLCVLAAAAGAVPPKEEVYAGAFDNAYTYNTTYGNQVVFSATTQNDGYLYYSTGARMSTAGIRFRTVGWKVSIKNNSGSLLQTIYYQMGGSNMACINITDVGSYQYDLYRIALSNIKGRMKESALSAMNSGNCRIVFDACMVVVKNGAPQGGIDDNGKTWGTVYTTYQGIAGAANWSSDSKIALQGFYNKSVSGLFYTITLSKGVGIKSVSGGGTYCYGATATIKAVLETGYEFSYWNGPMLFYEKEFQYCVRGSCAWTAYAKQLAVTVTFYRNQAGSDSVTRSQVFSYGNTGQAFADPKWSREGYQLTGWAHSAGAEKAEYTITNSVSSDWISKYAPAVSLYGVWEENRYTFVFDGNGADGGSMADLEAGYEETLRIPRNRYKRESERCTFLGWSMAADAVTPEYPPESEFSVKNLVRLAGVSNTNHARITLYAVWDLAPAVQAKDLYYTLADAQRGRLTERELASHMAATDPEDGRIPYGNNGSNSFLLTDYAASDFLYLTQSGSVTENAVVTDSSGNVTERMITIHLTDTKTKTGTQFLGKSRFISMEYFEDERRQLIPESEGGLKQTSCWVKKADYRSLLRSALNRMT